MELFLQSSLSDHSDFFWPFLDDCKFIILLNHDLKSISQPCVSTNKSSRHVAYLFIFLGLPDLIGSPLSATAELNELVYVEETKNLRLARLHLLARVIQFVLTCSHHDLAALKTALDKFARECFVDHYHVSYVKDLFQRSHDLFNHDLRWLGFFLYELATSVIVTYIG